MMKTNSCSEQSKTFVKAARELGCDEDPAHFEEILKKVARHKPNESRKRKISQNDSSNVAEKDC